MLISELEATLKAIREEHGDLELIGKSFDMDGYDRIHSEQKFYVDCYKNVKYLFVEVDR